MPSPPLSIVQSLSPRIAVLTSQDVIQSCEANGCRGLEELLRPWEGGTERVSILSTTLSPTIHPTFPVRFVSFESVYTNPALSAPSPDVTVDLISSFVGAKKPDEEQHYAITRSLLLSSRPLASHETFNHPVGILFAVSTATPDPLGTLNKLHTQSTTSAMQNVPWMDGNTVLRFYVVVHDVNMMGDDMAPAHELLANVKKAYGPHSTLLVINSQIEHREPPMSPDIATHPSIPLPRPFTPEQSNPSALSQLTAEDTQRLAALVRELVVQSLVPWMEARVREWNEVYHANRRGITGRLFGAGRKFFGSRPNSPSPGTTPTGYNTVKGYYPTSAVEALSRRLADFAFMLRDYKFAGGVYDSLRKDFAQDRAWRYAAGATELYGLCLLLSHPYFLPSSPPNTTTRPIPFTNLQHTEITSWLEQAITAYHQHSPVTQIQLDALRITVLYYEAWKAIGEWRNVGYCLVKGSGEVDEVPSAVMIEEAAAADVKGGKSQKGKRRRAFHLVLAARRYETAGLKTYSRRCLERASQIYRDSPWTSAQDRIEYSLGRQAYTSGESDVAVEHFLRLLRREDTGVPGSQGGPLQDMAQAYEQLASRPELLAESSEKLQLPTPVFDVQKTQIIPSSEASTSGASRDRWVELEAQALNTWDRKGKKPMALLPDEKRITVGVDETFQVELSATNPLNAPLVLKNITTTFDSTESIDIETIPEITLDPYETRTLSISVTPRSASVSTLNLSNVTFLFHQFFPCTQSLVRKGKRLHATKAQRVNPTYAEDQSLTVSITPSKASLFVELEGIPERLYEGEVVEGKLRLINRGKLGVGDVGMIWDEYGMIRRKDDTKHQDTSNTNIPNTIQNNTIQPLYADDIPPGEQREVSVIFTATKAESIELLGLVLFSTSDDNTASTAATSIYHSVVVRPLLRLNAQIRSTGHGVQEYTIVLQATNYSSEVVKIGGISGISPVWIVNSNHSSEIIHPNQTLRSLLSVKYNKTHHHDLRQSNVIEALGRLVKGQPIEEVSTDLQPDISLTSNDLTADQIQSYLVHRQLNRLEQISAQFPTILSGYLGKLFQLVDPLHLDLVVDYSIVTSPSTMPPRNGSAYIHSLSLAPSFSLVEGLREEINALIISGNKSQRTMYEETSRLRRLLMTSVLDGVLSREDDPVRVRVKVGDKGKVKHDFKVGPIRLPITFEISNTSPLLPTRYVLNLPKPSSTPNELLSTPQYVESLVRKGQLQPGEKEEVKVDIWVHEPGVINLGKWEMLTEVGGLVSQQDGNGGEGQRWKARRSWSRIGGEKRFEIGGL
uniref:TPPC8 first Ig-like domain-containing protein n=1 Tax=Kwoniella bestiolae CBS 10118 TaxID=1296100 RepID=A0A1B9GE04_9TREE|nr:hypothetical protein I302_00772 [Kwoniella bestiolae CBS 10118]OCF29273.1 hypothetical protein I302_00772 [Kwoniella bestiolae CBS 10118]